MTLDEKHTEPKLPLKNAPFVHGLHTDNEFYVPLKFKEDTKHGDNQQITTEDT